ncbi:IS110 family transposase [Sphingopyxis sp. NFH-91]|uniref:IS110 family transposase n=1 Tax=Sphingopyxis sp. NFH-91 TaxID=2744457 RepID=UPI001F3BDAF9|nr:IS110 family transposase [Sphingopyxis sp. NFH-91]
MSKKLWVGLDVGVDTMTICVLNALGEAVREDTIASTAKALDEVLRPYRRSNIANIGMEAGSTSIILTRALRKMKYSVSVFECRQVSAFLGIKRNKTDKNDARCIAEVARSGPGALSDVYVKSAECQHIRSMLVMRQRFVRMRVAGELAIGSLFRLNGGKLKRRYSGDGLRRTARAEVVRLRREQKIDLSAEIDPMLAICGQIRDHVEAIDKRLTALAKESDLCRKFMAIPGVGPITALSFFSAIEDPFRFKRTADVGAYFGLVPRVRQSGATVARLRISKMGNTLTRQHLNNAAAVHLRSNSAVSSIKLWGERVRERRGGMRARTAVARKLAVVMLALWKKDERFDPKLSPSPTPPGDDGFLAEAAGPETRSRP